MPRSLPAFLRGLPAHAVLLGAAVYLGALAAYHIRVANIVSVWVPAGIALGIVARADPRRWPLLLAGVYAGNVLADLQQAIPTWLAVVAPLVNIAETVLAAWIVRRVAGPHPGLDSLGEVLAFVLGAVVVANAVTTLAGATVLTLAYHTPLLRGFVSWWVGDALGMLVVTPVVWALLPRPEAGAPHPPAPGGRHELLVLALLGTLAAVYVFLSDPSSTRRLHTDLYLTFPFLLWCALRYGARGAAWSNLALTTMAVASAGHGFGAFGVPGWSPVHRTVELCVFLAVSCAGSLAGAAMGWERRRATGDLAAAVARYRLFFDANPEAMWVYDRETLAFLAVNETAVRRYGWTPEEFLRMTLRDIRPPEEVARLERAFQGGDRGLAALVSVRHRTRDGRLMDVEITSHPLQFAGRVARIAVARDVTERRRLEAQLHESQKVETLGALASGIAHDFGNYLQAILSFADNATLALDAGHPAHEDIRAVRETALEAAGLTQQIMAYARRQPLSPQSIALDGLIARATALLGQLLGRSIEVVTDVPAGLGRVFADPGQLQQVLVNLAVNARDAMPDGGRLTISARAVTVEAVTGEPLGIAPGPAIALTVRDTGNGMDEEVRRRLFEPFFTTKGEHGTGLGLAVVFGIIRQSGGDIAVESAPGRGTAVTIRLPVISEGRGAGSQA